MPDPQRTRKLLSNPAVGFAPWIVMSVVVGPGRFEIAAFLALAVAALVGLLGARVGMPPKILDIVGVAFFAVLVAAGFLVDQSGLEWLERWAGEISNVAIALVALLSIAIRTPFTIQYAREDVEREHWDSPLFLHINYVITWVWTGAFLITAIVGYIGDGPLHEPDNVWTNWIVQIGVLILAFKFTDWYPDVATARDDATRGHGTKPAPPLRSLLLPLAGFVVPVGIVVLVVGGTWWIGVGLIVGGSALTGRLSRAKASQSGRSAA